MAVQGRLDQSNFNIVLSGLTLSRDNETMLQDAGRTAPLLRGTVMARIAASAKWVPLTDVTAVDGSAIARGVYMGDDVTAAALVAGDVTGRSIIVGGQAATLDGSSVIFENSVTSLDVVVVATTATVNTHLVEDDLAAVGLFIEGTIDIDELEN